MPPTICFYCLGTRCPFRNHSQSRQTPLERVFLDILNIKLGNGWRSPNSAEQERFEHDCGRIMNRIIVFMLFRNYSINFKYEYQCRRHAALRSIR